MDVWTDETVVDSGFGTEEATILRDLPHLGIVVSATFEDGRDQMRGRLSTWDRETKRRIRCRVSIEDASAQASWTREYLPRISENGSLIFAQSAGRSGSIRVLAVDELESERRIVDLPPEDSIGHVSLSQDGRLLRLQTKTQGWRIMCMDTGEVLWKAPPAGDRAFERFHFSPCGRLAVVDVEVSVQSGSELFWFALYEARTGVCVLSGESSVYDESLNFSDDGTQLLLEATGDKRIRDRWTIPEEWQFAQTSPPLCPPSVMSWKSVLESMADSKDVSAYTAHRS